MRYGAGNIGCGFDDQLRLMCLTMNKLSRLRVGILCGPIHPKFGGPAAVVAAHLKVLSDYVDVTLFGVVDQADRHEVAELYPDAFLFDRTYPKLWYRAKG